MDAYGAQLERMRQMVLVNSDYTPTPDTTKICVKCKWCGVRGPGDTYGEYICMHSESIDVVTGDPLPAIIMRGIQPLCGPLASLYQARP